MVGKQLNIYFERILESITQIEEYTQWVNEANFLENKLLIDWCLMQLQHIGETVVQIGKLDHTFQLLDKDNIIGFRNLVSHQYKAVRSSFIWSIIQHKLPLLK